VACEECGFSYELVEPDTIAGRLRSFGPRFREALAGAGPEVASCRPEPAVWSALEYSCHIRDVFLIQRERAVLAQVEDNPRTARMNRDERVALCRYNAQAVPDVLDQLAMAAELCALVFQDLDAAAWGRRLVYPWPAPAERDVAWVGRHAVHEGEHHLMDVLRVLAAVTAAP
jgi:DNA segregation ATPase FtsK/SpoIIIE, S-DNA-T family